MASACSTDEDPRAVVDLNAKYEVPIDFARSVASQINLSNPFSQGKNLRTVSNQISDELIIQNGDLNAYYIFNFENDGFVLMSSDFRTYPLLAYSDKGDFAMPGDTTNQGVGTVMLDYIEYVGAVRDSVDQIPPGIRRLWESLYMGSGIDAPLPDDPCLEPPCDLPGGGEDGANSGTDETWGPYLTSTWGQGEEFNNDCPQMGCTDDPDGRALVGCVAVAVGQIMRYYEHPSAYNWNLIPEDSTDVTLQTAFLLRDIGDDVNMHYGCGSSWAFNSNAKKALRDDYGYSSSIWHTDFSLSECTEELLMHRPVYLSACTDLLSIGGISIPNDCHAWVTDGLRKITSGGASMSYLYMNWGWYGRDDAWYLYYDWNPGNNDFDEHKKMISNIYPD